MSDPLRLACDLRQHKALITGASSGLGAHFARVLAQAGAEVILAARRRDLLDSLTYELRLTGARVSAVQLDVCDASCVAELGAKLGSLDVLVNNAGTIRESTAFDQTEEDWDLVLDTNLKGMFLLAQMAGRLMQSSSHGGSIINIASILGIRPAGGVLAYSVSKAGLIQMTKSLALEWARFGIRVNAIAPGYINTDLNAGFWGTEAGQALVRRIPQRRLGQLEDLDGPLLLLASQASRYMTGSILTVDGGHLVSSL